MRKDIKVNPRTTSGMLDAEIKRENQKLRKDFFLGLINDLLAKKGGTDVADVIY